MSQHRFLIRIAVAATIVVALVAPFTVPAAHSDQKFDALNKSRVEGVLRDAYDTVKKHYYDPKFHGLDWDAHYAAAKEKLKTVTSLSQGFGVTAGFLDELNDSHTFFQAPARPFKVDYGYRFQMYGNNCFVTRVRPDTDAVGKVSPGDQVFGYNNYAVNRADLWKLNYYYNSLAPLQASTLAFRDPSGKDQKLTIPAKVKQEKRVLDLTFSGADGGNDFWNLIRETETEDHLVRQRVIEMGDVAIWKNPEFNMENDEVDRIFNIARKHKALIIDLRGNPGGAVLTMDRMIGNLFDHEIKVADRTGRKELKPEIAKSRGKDIFTGKLIVLVDSQSASASEVFSRVIQLEKRGIVVGDQSSGAVMESLHYAMSQGMDVKFFYGFSVTEADLIMKDGKSLEHVGVTPDILSNPTAKDLADGSDPVLSTAAELVDLKLDPAAAGKLFPFEWAPN
ncbi:MAG: S41 family peptidase [Candidatus Acidiferrales bacterium]